MGSADVQGDLWGSAARDWAELQEPTAAPLWRAMLDAAHVQNGTHFLDVGCGSGGACLLAFERDAIVYGLDASEPLLNIARERVPGGDFRVGDLEALPYPDRSFDVVMASLSVMYAASVSAAIADLERVCKQEGRVLIAVWGLPENCQQRFVMQAIRDNLPTPPPAGGGPFALSMPGVLEALVEQTGLQVVGEQTVDCPFEYPNIEIHWQAQRSAGPVQAALRTVAEATLRAAVERAIEPFKTPNGGVRLDNQFRFVLATPQ